MGKYFGREPRYSRQEAEAQAKQAIDALVSKGRPPAEEWKGLDSRMGEINRELAERPRVDLPPPPPRPASTAGGPGGRRRDVSQILRPRPVPAPDPEPQPAPVPEAAAAQAPPTAPAARRGSRGTASTPPKRARPTTAPPAAAAPAPGPAKAKRATKKRSGS